MERLRASVTLVLVYAVVFLAGTGGGLADSRCADTLADMALRTMPVSVEFLGCAVNHSAQDSPLEIKYRFSGESAALVEADLIKRLRIKKIKRVCCTWESVGNFYSGSGKGSNGFVIDVGSGETLVKRRSDWAGIPH